MDLVSDGVVGLSVSSRSERGWVIAALSGELDIACAPALREQLLGLLRPAASRLVIDLSRVSYADASGLTVLVGTRRRAGLLGGFLRLAAPAPPVAKVLRITGLHRRLDIFPTVQAAITSAGRGQRPPDDTADAGTGIGAGTVHTGPARGHTGRTRHAADAAELRLATAAVLMHADAWRDADPHRRFTAALHALARAYAGTSQAALTRAAHSLLSVLTRQPLTYSPAVAATASRLRRLLDPIAGPPSPEANPAHAPSPGPAGPHRPAARGNERSDRSLRASTRHCARPRAPVTRDRPRAVAARFPPVNLPVRSPRRRPAECNPRVSSEPGGRPGRAQRYPAAGVPARR